MPELSIVVPTRNEEANVHDLLGRIGAALEGISYEVIVVDDSDDDTPGAVERERRAGRPVRAIHREGEDRAGGLSTAIAQGMATANGACIACLDADLQHPPEKLPDLVAALELPTLRSPAATSRAARRTGSPGRSAGSARSAPGSSPTR